MSTSSCYTRLSISRQAGCNTLVGTSLLTDFAAHEHIRLACLCAVHVIEKTWSAWENFESTRRGSLDTTWAEALTLEPSVLRHTAYAGVALWAMFLICTTTGRSSHSYTALLRLLLQDLHLTTWQATRTLLLSFIYTASASDYDCSELWRSLH